MIEPKYITQVCASFPGCS